MKNWQDTLVRPNRTIREALQVIDATGLQIVLVVDEQRKLLGTLSDGDIRRALLGGAALTDTVEKCIHLNPKKALNTESSKIVLSMMRKHKLHQMPIVDCNNVVVGLKVLDEYLIPASRENWVVLMAGGLGSRLGNLVESTPKPMLNVGDKPLLETIVLNFIDQGFSNFYFAVNYKAEVIEQHFGDGARFGANIRYLRETKRMGTAGALSLLPEMPTEPIFVANGDLLAQIDYAHMLDEHEEAGVDATMGVSEYEFQIPYGVVREADGFIQRIEEKPVHKSLISAGVNVISPAALRFVPEDSFLDMPDLFERLIASDGEVRCYKVHGYWLDIGRVNDYHKANLDIGTVHPGTKPAAEHPKPRLVAKKPALRKVVQ